MGFLVIFGQKHKVYEIFRRVLVFFFIIIIISMGSCFMIIGEYCF
jgi:hypothetical protein